jgi:hypothetical protein
LISAPPEDALACCPLHAIPAGAAADAAAADQRVHAELAAVCEQVLQKSRVKSKRALFKVEEPDRALSIKVGD